jgi:hypothetical protein
MRYPTKASPYRQEADWRLPGACGMGGMRSYSLRDTEFLFGVMKIFGKRQ